MTFHPHPRKIGLICAAAILAVSSHTAGASAQDDPNPTPTTSEAAQVSDSTHTPKPTASSDPASPQGDHGGW
ncbi:hypothetical protein [Nonomuraea lactucae]|uniref:hypothetical protein n=1 Tax=Nonomuraea lactucae TaxID=2249762 RepID=UPI0013B45A71|nr:hypothetical protein [Nonomuraea lactucae]